MNNSDYISILKKNFSYWKITEEEYDKRRKEMDNKFSFNDVIWSLLNQKLLEYEFKKEYSDVRNMLLAQAQFLEKEKKIPLYQYIEIVIYDICLEYQLINQLKPYKEYMDYDNPNKTFIVLNIAKKVYKYRDYYDKIDLKKIYSLCPMDKPISYEEFDRIINKIINKELDIDLYNQYLTEILE